MHPNLQPTVSAAVVAYAAICYSSDLALMLSQVIFCLAPCLHTHKMEGSGKVPIQNSFVVLPAPYSLGSCREGPGEPYHGSICKCPCTWATARACWDWELIYANLRETVTATTQTLVAISPPPAQHLVGEKKKKKKRNTLWKT